MPKQRRVRDKKGLHEQVTATIMLAVKGLVSGEKQERELARKIGVSEYSIRTWFYGLRRPGDRSLLKLAAFLKDNGVVFPSGVQHYLTAVEAGTHTRVGLTVAAPPQEPPAEEPREVDPHEPTQPFQTLSEIVSKAVAAAVSEALQNVLDDIHADLLHTRSNTVKTLVLLRSQKGCV